MPGAVPGTQYYGFLDGVRTTAILVSVPDPNDAEPVYLLAVPPPTPETARLQQVRDPQHPEAMLPVVLKAVAPSGMKGLRRSPPSSGPEPLTWGEDRYPRLDDLVALRDNPAALPIDVTARRVIVAEAEDLGSEADPQHETELERVNLAERFFPSPQRSGTVSAAVRRVEQGTLDRMASALDRLAEDQATARREQRTVLDRLSALEQTSSARAAPPADRGTGVFSIGTPQALNSDDQLFLASLLDRRPTSAPPPPTTTMRAPPVHRGSAPGSDAAGPTDDPALRMLERTTTALEMLAGAGDHGRVGMPKAAGSQLFKLDGARGRVAQDLLNSEFERDPTRVVREFEEAVARLKQPEDPQGVLPAASIMEAWREHVPARDHMLVVRVSEAVLSAYTALRSNQVAKGMARLALLLAALEQHTLDGGKWTYRAETLLGMPPAPMHLYHAPSADTKPKPEGKDGKLALGPLAQFCSPQRATTALAVFKENHPSA